MSGSRSIKALTSYNLESYFPCLLRVVQDNGGKCYLIEDYVCAESYKENDTVFFIFGDGYPRGVEITIINGYYNIKMYYRTTLLGRFPESKDDDGIYYEPKLMYQEVVIDKENVEVGDTIHGFFYLVTEKYRYEDHRQSESIYAIFKVTIDGKKQNKQPCEILITSLRPHRPLKHFR